MNHHLQNYFRSFRLNKNQGIIFLIDIIFVSIVAALFYGFKNYTENRSFALTQGQSTEQLKQILINNPQQLALYLSQLKSFLLIFLIGLVLLVVISLLLYSFSRALIWNYLHQKKTTSKNWWRWNLLSLALLVPLLIYAVIYLILKLAFSYLLYVLLSISPQFYSAHLATMESIRLFLLGTFSLFLVLWALIFIFLAKYNFVQKGKVWSSLGEAFGLIKSHWSKIWRMILLTLLTGIILTLVAAPLKSIWPYQTWIQTVITVLIALLFVAWLRTYLLKNIQQEHHEPARTD